MRYLRQGDNAFGLRVYSTNDYDMKDDIPIIRPNARLFSPYATLNQVQHKMNQVQTDNMTDRIEQDKEGMLKPHRGFSFLRKPQDGYSFYQDGTPFDTKKMSQREVELHNPWLDAEEIMDFSGGSWPEVHEKLHNGEMVPFAFLIKAPVTHILRAKDDYSDQRDMPSEFLSTRIIPLKHIAKMDDLTDEQIRNIFEDELEYDGPLLSDALLKDMYKELTHCVLSDMAQKNIVKGIKEDGRYKEN